MVSTIYGTQCDESNSEAGAAGVILGYTDVEVEQRVNDRSLVNVEEPGEDNAEEASE